MSKSKVDIIYRSLLFSKFFVKGWGYPSSIKLLLDLRNEFGFRKNIEEFIRDTNVQIISNKVVDGKLVLHGEFLTPIARKFPQLIPKESHIARFEIILPNAWKNDRKAICIHLAGTGDHFYWRRRHFMANPLVDEANIGAVILENPFYGVRKPKEQQRSQLYYVSDIFVMGACLITECSVLLKWCEQQGFGPLGITGVSMGGHMASLAAAAWPKPVVLIPCLSWTTASSVFTEGVLAESINWELLTNQLYDTPELACLLGWKPPITCSNINGLTANVLRPNMNPKANRFSKFAQFQDLISMQKRMQLQKYLTANRLIQLPLKYFVEIMAKKNPRSCDENVKQFMRLIMDEFTDLRNYPKLIEPHLCITIVARYDAYVPRDGCADIKSIWNGVDIRIINAGHVTGIVRHNSIFRKCIVEAFERAQKLNKCRFQSTLSSNNCKVKNFPVIDLQVILDNSKHS